MTRSGGCRSVQPPADTSRESRVLHRHLGPCQGGRRCRMLRRLLRPRARMSLATHQWTSVLVQAVGPAHRQQWAAGVPHVRPCHQCACSLVTTNAALMLANSCHECRVPSTAATSRPWTRPGCVPPRTSSLGKGACRWTPRDTSADQPHLAPKALQAILECL